jgi:hypothetical protein
MSDKQLTVAELLARAGRESEGGEAPRRRRRSLDEGGISVAELTGSIPAVKEKPAESKHSSVPIDGPGSEPEAEKASGPEVETEQPETESEVEAEAEQAPEPEESTPTPATDQTVVLDKIDAELPEPESAPEQTGVIALVDEPEVSEDEDLDEQQADEEVEEKTSVTGVVLMTAIGVVLGVVVFKGFEMLWENFSRPVVAILAILVIAGMVGVVKALRTTNDALSMMLAGLVGLLMTFGPLAVVML